MTYTTVVSGTTITATWGNQVRDQLVHPFASSSARSSAITAPFDGQLTYLEDTDRFEGRIQSGWQHILDWRCGKGLVYAKYRTTASTLITGVTSEATAFTKTVTGLTTNRVYVIYCQADCYNASVNATAVRLRVKDGTTQVGDSGFVPLYQAGFPTMCYAWALYTASASSVTLNVTLELSGTGTAAITSGTGTPFVLAVTDTVYSNTVLES